jgi:hypothetical protein
MTQSWPPDKGRLEELLEDALTDACGEEEQATGLYTMIEENLVVPFLTEILGVMVTVQSINLTNANTIVAQCERNGKHQNIHLLDLPLPDPKPEGAEWIEVYRLWASGMDH